MHSGGFSSLLKGWLHKAGVQGQQKLKNVCDLHTLKLAKNSENIMFIVAHNMGKMKQLLLSNPKSSRGGWLETSEPKGKSTYDAYKM